jgi:hypothetical protein
MTIAGIQPLTGKPRRSHLGSAAADGKSLSDPLLVSIDVSGVAFT